MENEEGTSELPHGDEPIEGKCNETARIFGKLWHCHGDAGHEPAGWYAHDWDMR